MNILLGFVISIFAGVSFYFNYEAQLHIEKQGKEIQIYQSEIKRLNERLLILQELEENKKVLEINIQDQEAKITQQALDIENFKNLLIEISKNKKHR
jgi:uncharacterized membrane protein (DUF106 family)